MSGDPRSEKAARYERVISIFQDVCDLRGTDRSEALERLCGNDARLRARIEDMLRHDSTGASLFEAVEAGRGLEVVAGSLFEEFGEDLSEIAIEGYELLREVGRGGMGVIYEARQASPSRRVAIKLMRAGMAHGDVVRRFERESHVLAQLHHPGIAQIHEAGVAESGGQRRPYFSMEFVEGYPLDRYIHEHGLDTRQRLELLARVCDAVGYANDRGVIHRDLKPGNILVVGPDSGETSTGIGDGIGTPKVLDFGIARVTDPAFETTTIETMVGQIVGTLSYMSPEQLAGSTEELDARCDVYALGAIGYELLTGQRAHQIHGLSVPEAARVVRDVDPAPVTSFDKGLAGDVATIIAKAMEKDRERRYASAGELAADLRRHLTHVPIVARPASALYQFSRFARRNGGLVSGVAAAVVVLVMGVIGTGSGLLAALEANRELETANGRLRESNEDLARVAEFQAAQLSENEPSVTGARLRDLLMQKVPADRRDAVEEDFASVSFTDFARESFELSVLAGSRRAIDQKFADEPLLRARLLQSLATTRLNLGLLDGAMDAVREALEVRTSLLHSDHPDVFESFRTRSRTFYETGDYGASIADARAIVDWSRRVRGEADVSTIEAMNWLSTALRSTDALEESYNIAVEARSLGEAALGENHRATIEAISLAGAVMLAVGRYEEALPLLLEADRRYVASLGPEHDDTVTNSLDVGLALSSLGRFDEEEERLAACIEVLDRELGALHPRAISSRGSLGFMLTAASRYREAIPLLRTVYEQRLTVLGDRHPSTLIAANNLAASLDAIGDYDASEVLHRSTLVARRALHGDLHESTLITVGNLAAVVRAQGRIDEALPLYRECADGFGALAGPDNPGTLNAIQNYAVALLSAGHIDESIPLYREALEGRRRVLGETHPATLNSIYNMGDVLRANGDLDAAEPYCEEALRLYREVLGEDHVGTRYSANSLAQLRLEQHRPRDAETLFRLAHEGFAEVFGEDHPATLNAVLNIGRSLRIQGKLGEAEPYCVSALEGCRRALGADSNVTLDSLGNLGELRLLQERHGDAEALFREQLEGRTRTLGPEHLRTRRSAESLARALELLGRDHEATEPRAEEQAAGSSGG